MTSAKQFDLSRVFSLAAADMIAARDKSKLIHRGASNIRTAGDEVEIAVRRFFKERLPVAYYVGQGHIIDESANCSGQLDIVIADNFGCPVLFQAENGTEYFIYDSVYAIGEIKCTYSSIDSVKDFSDRISHIRETLNREPTSNDFFSSGRGRGFSIPGYRSSDKRPCKNPLFSFMFFVDSENLNEDKLFDFYQSSESKLLPSLICFLDRGTLGLGLYDADSYLSLHDLPEFASYYREPGQESLWTWLTNSEQSSISSTSLSYMFFTLLQHLRNCTLTPPDLNRYVQRSTTGQVRWKPLLHSSISLE